jgi:hypothetical protein
MVEFLDVSASNVLLDAVISGYIRFISICIEYGIDLIGIDESGEQPRNLFRFAHPAVIDYIFEHSNDTARTLIGSQEIDHPIVDAFRSGHYLTVTSLLSHDPTKVKLLFSKQTLVIYILSPFELLLKQNKPQSIGMIEYLLTNYHKDINFDQTYTVLRDDYEAQEEELIDRYQNGEESDINEPRTTLRRLLCQYNHFELFKLYLEKSDFFAAAAAADDDDYDDECDDQLNQSGAVEGDNEVLFSTTDSSLHFNNAIKKNPDLTAHEWPAISTTIIHDATFAPTSDFLQYLIDNNIGLQYLDCGQHCNGFTPIHYACRLGNVGCLQLLLNCGKIDLDRYFDLVQVKQHLWRPLGKGTLLHHAIYGSVENEMIERVDMTTGNMIPINNDTNNNNDDDYDRSDLTDELDDEQHSIVMEVLIEVFISRQMEKIQEKSL